MGYSNGFLRVSSSGKFVGVLKYRDACGQQRQVTKTFTADRAESESMLASWRAAMREDSGPALQTSVAFLASGLPTVEEAVRACLKSDLSRGRIERSTHDMQLAAARRDVFPELGAVPIEALTPTLVQSWCDRLCSRLSPGTALVAFSTLSKACDRAVREGLAATNPVKVCDAPRKARPARAYLPPASIALLRGAVADAWGTGHPYACAVELSLLAGLRAGECCGLRWRDVEEDFSGLSVAASVGRSDAGCYLKGPKNASSARDLPLVPALSSALAARAVVQASGEVPDPAWFVCGEEGRFLDPRTLSRAFSRLCERADVTDSTGGRPHFHELRHTFATNAVRAGVDVRTLADIMGHSRADVTLNVYAASSPDAKEAAVARMAAWGGGASVRPLGKKQGNL